jgi:hypothetical protein
MAYKIVVESHVVGPFEILSLLVSIPKISPGMPRKSRGTYVYEVLNSLLNYGRRRSEPRHKLPDDFVDEVIMSQALLVLHNADNASLKMYFVSMNSPADDLELTSIWCLRSSSTFSCVSARSSLFSTLPTIV